MIFTQNKKNSELWLGIDALGLKVYAKDNRMVPEVMFAWNEIKTIICRDRKVRINVYIYCYRCYGTTSSIVDILLS